MHVIKLFTPSGRSIRLMIIKSKLRLCGHDERKDDNYWVKRYMTWEVEGIERKRTPEKDLVGLC